MSESLLYLKVEFMNKNWHVQWWTQINLVTVNSKKNYEPLFFPFLVNHYYSRVNIQLKNPRLPSGFNTRTVITYSERYTVVQPAASTSHLPKFSCNKKEIVLRSQEKKIKLTYKRDTKRSYHSNPLARILQKLPSN